MVDGLRVSNRTSTVPLSDTDSECQEAELGIILHFELSLAHLREEFTLL